MQPLDIPNLHLCPTRSNIDFKRPPKHSISSSKTTNLEPKEFQPASKRHFSTLPHTCIQIYSYTYIFAGPLALGVVRSQTSILYRRGLPPPIVLPLGGPGARSCCIVAQPWLSCGLVVAQSWLSRGLAVASWMGVGAFQSHPERSWGSMLAHVGSGWNMLAPGDFKLAPR